MCRPIPDNQEAGTGVDSNLPFPQKCAASTAAFLLFAIMHVAWFLNDEPCYDEIVTIQYLDEPTLTGFLAKVRGHSTYIQPIYFVLEYYWAQLFGSSVRWLRLPPKAHNAWHEQARLG